MRVLGFGFRAVGLGCSGFLGLGFKVLGFFFLGGGLGFRIPCGGSGKKRSLDLNDLVKGCYQGYVYGVVSLFLMVRICYLKKVGTLKQG